MASKPSTASGYTPAHLELVRATCIYVATKLGHLMDDLCGGRRAWPYHLGPASHTRRVGVRGRGAGEGGEEQYR